MNFIQEDTKTRKILTESGVWIPATYKTDRYERWRTKAKVEHNERKEESDDEAGTRAAFSRFTGYRPRGAPMGMNLEGACSAPPAAY